MDGNDKKEVSSPETTPIRDVGAGGRRPARGRGQRVGTGGDGHARPAQRDHHPRRPPAAAAAARLRGEIREQAPGSTQWWPPRAVPPGDAPDSRDAEFFCYDDSQWQPAFAGATGPSRSPG